MKAANILTGLVGAGLIAALAGCGGGSSSSDTLAHVAHAQATTAGTNVGYAPVRIIAFNDVHGYISAADGKLTSVVPVAGNPAGAVAPTGGLNYMATLIASLRSGQANSIVVAAGDNIGASPFPSGIAHDEPTVDILNHLSLEVSSVGNHEFDKGLTELYRIQGTNGTSLCYPPDGQFGKPGVDTCLLPNSTYTAPTDQFNGANWTYLAANVVNSASGQTIFPSTYIKKFPDANGKRGPTIGFIGLTFKNTPLEVNQNGVAGLTFGDEATAINLAARTLRAQKVNAIVVLIHQGAFTTSTVYGDTTCPGFNGDLLPVLDKLSENVNVVISGHTHTDYVCKYKGMLVTQSGFYGTGVTAIDLKFDDGGSGELDRASAFNTPVINNTTALPAGVTALVADPTVTALVSYYEGLSAAAGAVVVGSINSVIPISPPPAGCATAVPPTCDSAKRNKTVESPMGDLSADAYYAAFNDSQIAFVQAGGVRTALVSNSGTYPGNVSYAALFATNPFHDTLIEVSMTGPQILRALEQQWEAPNNTSFFAPGGVGEILMPSGLTYTWDSNQPAGQASGSGARVVTPTLKLVNRDGTTTPIDLSGATTYRVVIQNFLYSGGDSFSAFKSGTNPVQGGFDINALTAYFKSHSPVSAPSPTRITKLGSNP